MSDNTLPTQPKRHSKSLDILTAFAAITTVIDHVIEHLKDLALFEQQFSRRNGRTTHMLEFLTKISALNLSRAFSKAAGPDQDAKI